MTAFAARVARVAHTAVVAAVVGACTVTGTAGASVANAAPVIIEVTTPEGVYGDPDEAAEFWQRQHLSDNCVLMAVADVVGQITGDLPSEQEMLEVAADTPSNSHTGPVYLPDDNRWGTDYADTEVLFAEYGIDATMTSTAIEDQTGIETGTDALVEYLAAGEKVIVGLNGPTIWGTSGDRSKPAHAVVVTGVDTANDVVHLNDPYPPDGRNFEVPLAVFEKAWRTGPFIMIVTDEAA
jgi:Peptidase_C39 like family